MFCYKCGTQIPDSSKFCSNCGAQISSPQASPQRLMNNFNINSFKIDTKFDTKTIICFIVAAVMLLSMLVLPMFTLESSRTYTISLLGDNYMPMKSTQTTINTLSRVAFIFMLAAVVATVVFRITKKFTNSFISSLIGAGVLFFYDVSILGTWMSGGSYYDERAVIPGAANVLCIGCIAGLIVLSFLALKKEKENNQPKSAPPSQPMIFR